MLYAKLITLASQVQQGDFIPTDQQVAVHKLLQKNLESYKAMFDKVLKDTLPNANQVFTENNFPKVILPTITKDK